MRHPTFSIGISTPIGHIGGGTSAAVSIVRAGDEIEEASIGRTCGTSIAA